MPRSETYPPHLQRAIDEAEAKLARRRIIGTPETDKAAPAKKVRRNYPPDVTISNESEKADTHSRRDRLNATEAAYLAHLQILKVAGELTWIGEHESIAFRIADGEGKGKKASYRPDFPVVTKHGRFELHEVKGHWREAARLRIKVAASTFGFRFVGVTKAGDFWNYEEFGFGPRAEEGAHR